MYLLGISAFYHDAAAALIKDGKIIAAAQEERFSRIKHDESFPIQAINFCLQFENISINDIEAVVFYEKPFLKFERLLETYLAFAPKGIQTFIKSMSVWSKKKLFIKKIIKDELEKISEDKKLTCNILFSEHHLSHAASAYYPSPFKEAAVLNIDAVGESATCSIFYGKAHSLTCLQEMNFPHSVGLLYSAFTYFLGFKVNSGEYKLMGLAPYGNRDAIETKNFIKIIKEKLCTVYDDGSIFLHQVYFNYGTGSTMVKDKAWEKLFSLAKRKEEDKICASHCNLAIAIQTFTEDVILKLAMHAKKITGSSNLCMAGGVALNCVANGKLQQSGIFKEIFIQPAAGDAGGAIGAALAVHHIYYNNEKPETPLSFSGSCLGPVFSEDEIKKVLDKHKLSYSVLVQDVLYTTAARLLADGNIIGWFQGRMEFGPRALGNRSILADPRNPGMQQKLNLKIKFRENFRPFAPAVKEDKADRYFSPANVSSYMLFVQQVKDADVGNRNFEAGTEAQLATVDNSLPAITHVDGTTRVQTVNKADHPVFYKLLDAFENETGCPVLINTSFNVRGEPIVCSPEDAVHCFLNTEMDVLVLGGFLLLKQDQQNSSPLKKAKAIKKD